MAFDIAAKNDIALSEDALRQQLLRFLDEEPGSDDNLMDFGLNSIAAMQLVAEWKALNIDVSFAELAKTPTINGLWALLQHKMRTRQPEPILEHRS